MAKAHGHGQLQTGGTSGGGWQCHTGRYQEMTSLALITLFWALPDTPSTPACPPYLVDLSCTSSSSSSQVAPSGSTRCWEARKLNMSKVHLLQVGGRKGGRFVAILSSILWPGPATGGAGRILLLLKTRQKGRDGVYFSDVVSRNNFWSSLVYSQTSVSNLCRLNSHP